MGTTRQNADEAQIRRLVAAWAEAVERHDLAGVLAHHSADVRMFDVTVPPQLRGMEEHRASWRNFFTWLGDSGRFKVSELEVAGGADVATIGLLKLDGQWTVVHEHHSEAQPT